MAWQNMPIVHMHVGLMNSFLLIMNWQKHSGSFEAQVKYIHLKYIGLIWQVPVQLQIESFIE